MAAGVTYDPIATQTLGSAASTITFSSIPATYTDLRITMTYLANASIAGSSIQFNGDTASNYSETFIRGNGSAASSSRFTNSTYLQVGWQGWATTTIPQFCTVDIFSYRGSTFKTVLGEDNADRNGAGEVVRFIGLWRSTSAITSIVINENAGGGNYAAGSTFTLYGIKNA
jgi:pantothenate kinase